MKLTTEQQTLAILDLVIEMAAKNMAFHEMFVSTICQHEEQTQAVLKGMADRAADNILLLRAKVFQYASVDPNDLLNGLFDV
jgi:hypothetical protein